VKSEKKAETFHEDGRAFMNKFVTSIIVVALIVLNIKPLNPELNSICYLLALLAHHFLHVSRIRVKSLTLRLLMSYIWSAYS